MMPAPPLALAHGDQITRKIQARGRLALLTDFDGTLAAIRRDPAQVQLPRRTRELLGRLVAAGVLTGIVSGRSLRDVQDHIGLRRLWYAGSHGLAMAAPRGKTEFLATPAQRRHISALADRLDALFHRRKGWLVERKDGSLAIHYRLAGPRERVWGHQALALALASDSGGRPDVELRGGKCVWEIMPHAPHSKWTAIQRILKRARFAPGGCLLYLGDDVADEVVFQQMRKTRRREIRFIPILVGEARPSRASYRLRTADEVRLFLGRILEALA